MQPLRLQLPKLTVEQHVTLMTGVFRLSGKDLTKKEVQVLAVFVGIQQEIEKGGLSINPFSTEMKKEASRRMSRGDFNTLNNYIKSLKDKGVLKATEDGYTIHKMFVPTGQPVLLDFQQ